MGAKPRPPLRSVPRGPEPQTLLKWTLAVAKDGARRFRVFIPGEKEPKMVGLRNCKVTSTAIEAMRPTHVEALGDEGEILRVWQFTEREASSEELANGFVKDGDDSADERLLKTFAHLLHDAYRVSTKQLVEVVSIQANHFAEERKAHYSLRTMNERLMQSLAKKVARIRIANGETEGDGGEEEETAETPDTFMQDFVGPLIQKYVQTKVGKEVSAAAAGEDAAPAANGAKE